MRIITIDGESIYPYGYSLLGASDGSVLSATGRLSSGECFQFLLDKAGVNTRLFGFGLNYDAAHWIADLSVSEKQRLAGNGVTFTRQSGINYEVRYHPKAYFRVRQLEGSYLRRDSRSSVREVTITDLMRWFRRSFADTCGEWGIGDCEFLRAMKARRGSFQSADSEDVSEYNRCELDAMVDLSTKLIGWLKKATLAPMHPLTCGNVAAQLMSRKKVKEHYYVPQSSVMDASRCAFFGGRQQCFRFGRIHEPLISRDINSAYGWAMSQLPSLQGTWKRGTLTTHQYPYCLQLVQWDLTDNDGPLMPFPFREPDGRISYPPKGTAWQWGWLVNAAAEHFPGRVKVLETWAFTPFSNVKPFAWVEALHDLRHICARNQVAFAGVLKLILVSVWGNLCRDTWAGSLEWAGMTTAIINAALYRQMRQDPDGLVSCCVDGYWTEGLLAKQKGCVECNSTSFGGWSHKECDDMMMVSPTMYWRHSPETGWKAVSAGFAQGEELREEVLQQWDERRHLGCVRTTRRAFIGIKEANRADAWDRLGQFDDRELTIHLHPGVGHLDALCKRTGATWYRWLSYPPKIARVTDESAPYRRLEEGNEWEALQAVG